MNNENNNLNGVVLGSVSNQNGSNLNPSNTDNSVMPTAPTANPINTGNVVMPTETVVDPGNVQPSQVVLPNNPEPQLNNNIGQVVNPVSNGSEMSQPQVVNPSVSVEPTPILNNNVNQSVVQNSTDIKPQPEFTNINSINPSSNGTDNSIGTNPPISLENEKAPKKKGNKTLFVVVILLLLLAVALGTYYVLNYTDLLSKKETIKINTNSLTVNVGDVLSNNINDYANITGTNSSNCSLDVSQVDITKEGVYKYSITCSSISKEGNVTVVDNKILKVETKTVYAIKGDILEAENFVKNPEEKFTYSFENKEEVDAILNGELGNYVVKIKAISDSGKEIVADAKLVIMQYKVKGYSVCTSAEQMVEEKIMTITDRFAIVEDGNNGFGNIATETYIFKYNSESDYAKMVADYDENGTITINNVTGITEFDDSNLIIKITRDLDLAALNSEYGENNLKNYSTIRTYFTQNLGYSCVYEKVND